MTATDKLAVGNEKEFEQLIITWAKELTGMPVNNLSKDFASGDLLLTLMT